MLDKQLLSSPPHMKEYDYSKNKICPVCGSKDNLKGSNDYYHCRTCDITIEMYYSHVILLDLDDWDDITHPVEQ